MTLQGGKGYSFAAPEPFKKESLLQDLPINLRDPTWKAKFSDRVSPLQESLLNSRWLVIWNKKVASAEATFYESNL